MNCDNLTQFFAEQQALAEMSDEDMEEFEARSLKFTARDPGKPPSGESLTGQSHCIQEEQKRESRHDGERTNSSSVELILHDTTEAMIVTHNYQDRMLGHNGDMRLKMENTEAVSTKTSALTNGQDTYIASPTDRYDTAYYEMSRGNFSEVLGNPSLSTMGQTTCFIPPASATILSHEPVPTFHVASALQAANTSKQQVPAARDKVIKKLDAPVFNRTGLSSNNESTTIATTSRRSMSGNDGDPASKPSSGIDKEAVRAEKSRKTAEIQARKKEEAYEQLMTPTEYALRLHTKFAKVLGKTSKEKQFLEGKGILYVGGDLHLASKGTRKKMDFLKRKGATVAAAFDTQTVTHIVTDTTKALTLAALGLRSFSEIPNHIPTVTWSWITSGNNGCLDYEFMHAAFPSRINADPNKLLARGRNMPKGKALVAPHGVSRANDGEFSRIEDFSPIEGNKGVAAIPDQSSDNAQATSSKVLLPSYEPVTPIAVSPGDPLAEFYAQAMKDRDSAWFLYDERELDGEPEGSEFNSKSGFTCDNKSMNVGFCANQDIVDQLQELMEIHSARPSEDDRWRVLSYSKSIRAIRSHPKKIQTYAEALSIKGVGEKTALKIKEIIETGELRRVIHEKTDDIYALNIFKKIYGVGPHTAYKWYASGCRTLDDVKQRRGGIIVSPIQEIGIKYYDDINSRMPRSEAKEIFELIKHIALGIDNQLFFEIMGSYRRGKADCGDIDILMTRPTDDRNTHAGVLPRLLSELHLHGILTEDLVVPDNPNALEATYRGLCRRDGLSRRRRIDILAVPYICRGAALIYYTGDDIFNRAIRYKAGKMGYSLNQRGLFKNVVRDNTSKRRKLTRGTLMASESEEEIFQILGVPWQEPHERARSFS